MKRELRKLSEKGSNVDDNASRCAAALSDPELFDQVDEEDWDITRKKLFLFTPERIDISLNRLNHYTGTPVENFQRHIIFINYDMHVEVFCNLFLYSIITI